MAKKDLVKAFGIGEEMFRTMANLAHAVKAQGGEEDDLNLLKNDPILGRVAKLLARAGMTNRSFPIVDYNGKYHEIYLNRLSSVYGNLTENVKKLGFRLASRAELICLKEQYSVFTLDDSPTIIGEQIFADKLNHVYFWELARGWVNKSYEVSKNPVREDLRIAMILV